MQPFKPVLEHFVLKHSQHVDTTLNYKQSHWLYLSYFKPFWMYTHMLIPRIKVVYNYKVMSKHKYHNTKGRRKKGNTNECLENTE